MGIRGLASLDEVALVVLALQPVPDILLDGLGEHLGLLAHVTDGLVQVLEVEILQLPAAHQNLAIRWIVVPQDQRHECGLAAPGRAHKSAHLAGLHLQVDVLQYHEVGPHLVNKVHIPELNAPRHVILSKTARVGIDVRQRVHQAQNPLRGTGRLREGVHHALQGLVARLDHVPKPQVSVKHADVDVPVLLWVDDEETAIEQD
mmetsp:Transcript_6252/g.18941  ORF Transcript_6252/g.18941 Transcript_6252/m.18941 type:complete len:203 (-) Transcript_6252:805-1413(-)